MISDLYRTTALIAVSLFLIPACSSDSVGGNSDIGGTVIVAVSAEPASLLPPLIGSEHEQVVTEVVYDRLADIGSSLSTTGDEGFSPRLASSWTWSADSMSIAFHLNPNARWHDGNDVIAEDVALSFRLYTDPRVESRNSALLANIDSVTVQDKETAVFWFERRSPQQFYDATYHMFVMPSHLLKDVDFSQPLATSPLSRSPVGSGRFRFVEWVPGQRIEIIADTVNYRSRPGLDRVIVVPTPDFGSAVIKLFSGEADFFSPLRPENLEQAAKTSGIKVLSYPTLRYQNLTFNLAQQNARANPHSILGEKAVRQALSMALDRERIVQTVFDSLSKVASGPAPRFYLPESALNAIPQYNPNKAKELLDSLGWKTSTPDGIRSKNGIPLRIEILVPSTSVNRDRMALLIQNQWRDIGVEAVLQRLEVNALIERLESGRFDAYMGGWMTSPGLVGLRQVWSSASIGGEGSNYGSYRSVHFDTHVDSALSTFDAETATRTLGKAIQTILEDAPAVWLVEDGAPAGISARIRTGTLPATGWWHGLPEWSIEPSQRIARDNAGLNTAR